MTVEDVARWLAAARWRVRRDLGQSQLEGLLGAVETALAATPEPRKRERHKLIFELALAGTQPDHLLKVVQHRHASLVTRLGPAGAVTQWQRVEALRARGLETPAPVAAGVIRRCGLLDVSLLLLPIVPDAIDVAVLASDASCPSAQRRRLARELGMVARELHDAGIDQQDFAPNNFLWRPNASPHLLAIDFEHARIGRPLARRRRAWRLAKLDRHLHAASATDRLRLLVAYARGDARAARSWWQAVASAHTRLARRDFRHLRRTGTRVSRRFVPVLQDGWRGWARRGASLEPVLSALTRTADARPPGCWVQPLGVLGARAAARTWAAALTLAQRGCLPEPLGLLHRDGRGWLLGDQEPEWRVPADVDREAARAALVGLCGRLLGYGFDPAALPAETIRLLPGPRGGWRAVALDPRGLRPGRRSRTISARAWTAGLLGSPGPASARR